MLLLLVLLMLALFMGAGVILLTIAARARASARANAAAMTQSDLNEQSVRDALEEAILAAVRGAAATGTTGAVVSGTTSAGTTLYPPGENLLADKYGRSLTGSGSQLTGTNSPIMSFSLQLPAPARRAEELNGRILTIVPTAGDGDIASYRILGFESGSASASICYLAQLPSTVRRQYPARDFDIVINGREFTPVSGTTTPEPYDAFDDQNGFLAQPVLASSQINNFVRLSFGTSGPPAPTVDNDNDGVPDGVWIPASPAAAPQPSDVYVIPDRPSPLGGTVRYQVSYLILDLDGRINVNAAGMPSWPGVGNPYGGTPSVNLGMGYGPADIDASILFSGTVPTGSGTSSFTGAGSQPTGIWPNLLWSGTPAATGTVSIMQRRMPPQIGPIAGRYGPNGVPGRGAAAATLANDDVNFALVTGSANYPQLVSGNSIADLKARSRVYLTAPGPGEMVPAVNYFAPLTALPDWVDDPYELRLDADANRLSSPRRSSLPNTQNDDCPFTLAELERVLRPNDPDATQLPSRLAAGLQDFAQRSRTMITTDSWDSPALSGLAAVAVREFLSNSPPLSYNALTAWRSGTAAGVRNPVSPEIAAGLRFNLNRPVTSGSNAHEYCKGLYTLVMALSGTATPRPITPAQAAQWAVNVLDFRDTDSTMTGFEYDTNLANGWRVDGDLTTTSTTSEPDRAVVWGAERPDVVIAETAAWRDQAGTEGSIYVNLYRPPFAALVRTSSSGSAVVTGTTETLPLALSGSAGSPGLALSGTDVADSSPWQIVFTAPGSSGTVQFSRSPAAGMLGSSTLSGPVFLAANTHLCVTGTPAEPRFAVSVPQIQIEGGFRFGTGATTGSVRLQRLANPTMSFQANSNPYLTVDTGTIGSIAVKQPPAPPATAATWSPLPETWLRRSPADAPVSRRFWPQDFVSSGTTAAGTTQLRPYITGSSTYTGTNSSVATGTAPVPVFHWPNRPFISQAELALVPTGTGGIDGMLGTYSLPLLSLATSSSNVVVGLTGTSAATGTASGTATLGQLILDATYVPSRFAGNAITLSGTMVDRFGLDVLEINQLSKWREPGRVNVNTIVSGAAGPLDNIVWQTLVGGTSLTVGSGTVTTNPFTTTGTTAAPTPARSLSQLLSLSGLTGTAARPIATGSVSGTFASRNSPFLAATDVIRLANTATIRSNVFAIWVTVKITDDSANAPSPVTKRAFAIVDRSIPVGYSPGKDLNVRDCIRILRFLD